MNQSPPKIMDTFAEAFDMRFCRFVVTAHDDFWLRAAIHEVCGYGSSVIACDAELGVERWLDAAESPDGRLGAEVLAFGFSRDALAKAIPKRIGQCVMTCPTTAVFDGLPGAEATIPLGKSLRYFGDGYQKSKQIEAERFWRIPVMDGEFWITEALGVGRGIGGGNLILQAPALEVGLTAARHAVEALAGLAGTITPFPGGVARSGSKVGSRYPGLVASTSEAYCPTLKGRCSSQLVAGAQAALEIVMDATDREAMETAMRTALETLLEHPVLAVGAGNYGGKLGKHHFYLRDLTDRELVSLEEPE